MLSRAEQKRASETAVWEIDSMKTPVSTQDRQSGGCHLSVVSQALTASCLFKMCHGDRSAQDCLWKQLQHLM